MRVWSFLALPLATSLVIAACGGGPATVAPPVDGGSDATVIPPPQLATDGGTGGMTCKPQTCAELGYTCGANSDGCGNLINCGTCTSPAFCGGSGFSQCGGNLVAADSGGSVCVPKTCTQLGYNCGQNSDGCGNLIDCGSCTAPAYCGGAAYSQCGGNSVALDSGGSVCVPKTCAQLGYNCGPAGDGCGNMLDCGTCASPAFCGGAGFNQCGGNLIAADSGGSVCVPKTCSQLGYNCGPAGDGCGNTLNCGSCAAPAYCGGGGFNQCGGNSVVLEGGSVCVPKTCAQLGFNCGAASDGCGNLIPSCGTCTAPDICGGGMQPNVCGDSNLVDGAPPCTNLCLKQVVCDSGTTTISGTVYAPTNPANGYGNPDPLYDALVYIPNSAVQAFTPGVSCGACGATASGSPLVSFTTGPTGAFTLANAPCGQNIPLVIQLGRWRRQITIPSVACCANTALTPDQTRLPRNHTEGDIPLIAISTGSADPIECVLPKIGIDLTEFTNPGGGGRVQLYQADSAGKGATINASTPNDSALWGSAATLDPYDLVIFDCEGAQYNKTLAAQQNVMAYANAGGRVFASHYSYTWLYNINPFSTTANWVVNQGDPNGGNNITADIDVSFQKGQDFATWLADLNPSALSGPDQIVVQAPRHDTNAVNVPPSQRFLYAIPAQYPNNPIEFTFNTPVAAQLQCGRVLYSDFHVNTGGAGTGTFPGECPVAPMTPQEKVLEFMLFDLSSCVQNMQPPPPTCTPLTCAQENINCGNAGDGCGNAIFCGNCTPPLTCGGGGVFGQCGTIDAGHCVPQTCAQQNINCGPAGDGCGNAIQCGPCTPPQTCGGGGVNGQCGYIDGGMCTPESCQQQGIGCGPAGDGCGNTLQCGSCTPPLTCGGGGVSGQCGIVDAGMCAPQTCGQLGFNCGPAGDGCGGLLSCGTCTPPQTCGGGGQGGVCGYIDGGTCVPKTCEQLGFDCGPAGDGCGGQLNCGMCVSPQTCGGGGNPGVCGGGNL